MGRTKFFILFPVETLLLSERAGWNCYKFHNTPAPPKADESIVRAISNSGLDTVVSSWFELFP